MRLLPPSLLFVFLHQVQQAADFQPVLHLHLHVLPAPLCHFCSLYTVVTMAQPFPRTPSKKAGDFTPLRNGSNTFHQSTLVQILQWIEDNWLEGRELVSNLKRRVNFQAGIARRHDFVRLFKACCEASGYCRHIVVREIYRGGMDRPPIKVDVKVNLGMSPVTAAEFYGPKPTAPVIPMNTSLAAEPSDRRKRIENWVERNIQKPVDVLSPAQPDLPEDGGSKRCGKVARKRTF